MLLKNQWYDALKWVALILLPAVLVFLNQINAIYPWELYEEFEKLLQVFAIFLGMILQISSDNYHKDRNSIATKSCKLEGDFG